jgi:hypothetical protein
VDSTGTGIEAALLDFMTALRTEPKDLNVSWNSLEQRPAWAEVRARVADHVPESIRPDFYSRGDLNDAVLLRISGLEQAIQRAVISGDSNGDHGLADDFAKFCSRGAPTSQDWILLDAELPAGTRVKLGDHNLETHTYEDLLKVHPLPTAAAIDSESGPMPPRPLGGAAFLRSVKPDRPLLKGLRLRWPFDSRIELENWLPLFALLLWSPGITRAEAVFEVEPGRRIALVDGQPALTEEVYTAADGQAEEYLRHHKQGITVDEDELPAFTAFTGSVVERTQCVLAHSRPGLSKTASSKPRPKLARRLERAGQHLVRAGHRTHGPADDHEVSAYERHEVILHYVIALEALLADEDNLDLSRKVSYRAATLFGADDERERVAQLVKTAYGVRSKYAHGDDIEKDVDPDELRQVTRQVILRWLVLATSRPDGDTPPKAGTIPGELDRALLADTVRRAAVLKPLRAFFEANPSADPPSDLAT